MLTSHIYDATLSLGGAFHAALLTHHLAHSGQCHSDALEMLMKSLLVINPSNVEQVYGSTKNLIPGLKILLQTLQGSRAAIAQDCMRYFLLMASVENQLNQSASAIQKLRDGIINLDFQTLHHGLMHDMSFSNAAALYQATAGTMKTKILVRGDAQYLKDEWVVAKIRTSLLAGIRSLRLWKQLGGQRWHLFLKNKKIQAQIGQLTHHQP